jgi:hypothetical protein
MIFQVLVAISEFKNKPDGYYHSRVISLTKGIDKTELSGWNGDIDNDFPALPGIWKLTVWKVAPEIFIIVESKLVYEIGLV